LLSGRTEINRTPISKNNATPKNEKSLLALNKHKLRKIFNSHSWQSMGGK